MLTIYLMSRAGEPREVMTSLERSVTLGRHLDNDIVIKSRIASRRHLRLDVLADEGLVEHRWWSVDELDATDEILRPEPLPRLLREVLEFGAPARPHRFDD